MPSDGKYVLLHDLEIKGKKYEKGQLFEVYTSPIRSIGTQDLYLLSGHKELIEVGEISQFNVLFKSIKDEKEATLKNFPVLTIKEFGEYIGLSEEEQTILNVFMSGYNYLDRYTLWHLYEHYNFFRSSLSVEDGAVMAGSPEPSAIALSVLEKVLLGIEKGDRETETLKTIQHEEFIRHLYLYDYELKSMGDFIGDTEEPFSVQRMWDLYHQAPTDRKEEKFYLKSKILMLIRIIESS